MSKYRTQLRSALAGQRPITGAGITVTAGSEGYILHVLGPQGGPDLARDLLPLSGGTPGAVRHVAPAQWFVVGEEPLSHDALVAIQANLGSMVKIVDQSHGRVRIRVSGPMVERVLAKGTGVDLHESVFPLGRSTTCLIGHISSHVTRISDDAFELIVLRGFAESLWDDLAQMSAEFA
ncbi:sarcosine oxidase subunit gamma family protein (plasmid) [Rhizobium sp. CC1099]|uniref:sarcosine oxidase subunit gamma family protein n=1 Tax=Rhizobium sp. CC1099 TaxID=3039160 RepID=UPI0024B24724|nr:sarcosine oxidase subunit gamma family protein [Rhizobium sp. CC1099]WFU92239.1 sarcosine oxidase subunit gamma family protein [Rhizobium sp. CC1099]